MSIRTPLVALALALSAPAFAQTYSSSTVTTNGSVIQQSTVANGAGTTITGSTGEGTIASTGVTVDPQADRVLVSQIVAELAAAPEVQGAAIDVQVVGGRATLNGTARDMTQVENAKEIAQGVAGAPTSPAT